MSLLSDFAVPLLTAGITLSGGWLISTRVTDRWDRIKKRRELDLASAHDFQALYGEFFSIWKSWDSHQRYQDAFESNEAFPTECLWRTVAVEGKFEALLAKVASERELSDTDVAVLGAVRQGFRALRKAIREKENLDWRSADGHRYMAFKGLCVHTSRLLGSSPRRPLQPAPVVAMENFRRMTDNRHGESWIDTALPIDPPGPSGQRTRFPDEP